MVKSAREKEYEPFLLVNFRESIQVRSIASSMCEAVCFGWPPLRQGGFKWENEVSRQSEYCAFFLIEKSRKKVPGDKISVNKRTARRVKLFHEDIHSFCRGFRVSSVVFYFVASVGRGVGRTHATNRAV